MNSFSGSLPRRSARRASAAHDRPLSRCGARSLLPAMTLMLASFAAPSQAAESVVYSLGLHSNDGTGATGVARAADGAVYGTTEAGGSNGCGLLFKRGTDGSYTNLHVFQCGTDGKSPVGNPLLASDGNLYGVTEDGGDARLNCGVVYRYTPAGEYSVLYSFTGAGASAASANSCIPQSGLIEASDGFLYGTTIAGGVKKSNQGTVYRLSKDGVYTPLHSFDAAAGGLTPTAPLLQGADGALYGTTPGGGGDNGYGVIFRISTAGAFTTLFTFPDDGSLGQDAYSGLAQAVDGSFYGIVYTGLSGGYGGLYRLTTSPAVSVSIVHTFGADAQPGQSQTGPVLGADGAVYGLLANGGANGRGVIFRYAGGSYSVLHDFSTAEGYRPATYASPTLAGDGLFYAALSSGGAGGAGTLVRFDSSGNLSTLLSLKSPSMVEGREPAAALVQAPDGSLYGSTTRIQGGTGSLFRLAVDGSLRTVFQFSASSGDTPVGALAGDVDGSVLGVTRFGGASNNGTVFRFTPAADPTQPGTASTLYSFPPDSSGNSNGRQPSGALAQGSDGAFYGMTLNGGASKNYGTLFRVTNQGAFTSLFTFPNKGNTGHNPQGGLTAARDGFLYGVTQYGGLTSLGTIFRIGTSAGSFRQLYNFANTDEGYFPTSRPIQGADGALYGTADFGGEEGYGVVYRLTTAGAYSRLFSFDDYDNQGAVPQAPLLLAGDGNFYGTTSEGGSSGFGTVFRLTPQGAFSLLHSFTQAPDGDTPQAALVQTVAGDLYTSSRLGGSFNVGALVRLDGPADIPARLLARAASQSVNLSWTASARALSYNVYQSNSSGNETLGIAIASGLATPLYSASGLTDGTPYFFTVTALDGYGETQFSNEVSATPFTDATPNDFAFRDVSNGPIAALVTSNSITVSGINVPVPLVLSGDTSAQYSINGDVFKSYDNSGGQPMVSNGNTVQLRLTSSSAGTTPTLATLALGFASTTWTVTTAAIDDTPDAFNFKDKFNQKKNRFSGSGGVRVRGINVPVPISVGGDPSASYRLNRNPYTSASGMVKSGDLLVLRLKNPASGNTTTSMHVNIGAVGDDWSVTTAP